jgi:hypothetical protein
MVSTGGSVPAGSSFTAGSPDFVVDFRGVAFLGAGTFFANFFRGLAIVAPSKSE